MISRRTCPSRPQKFTAERNSGLSCQIGAAITRMSAESATSRSRKVGRPPITALRRSSEQPSFQPLSRFCQSHERPLKSLSVTAAQPFVPPPMHTLRLLRKRPCYPLTTSQAHLDFSRRGNPSFAHRFLLASIGQAAAVATGEGDAESVPLPRRRVPEAR